MGPFRLTLTDGDAAALADALGSKLGGWVPMIFPIRWLALPAIRAAIAATVDLEAGLLLHESQSFECATALVAGATYVVTAIIRTPPDDASRLWLQGTVTDIAGDECVQFQAGLRVVPRQAPDQAQA